MKRRQSLLVTGFAAALLLGSTGPAVAAATSSSSSSSSSAAVSQSCQVSVSARGSFTSATGDCPGALVEVYVRSTSSGRTVERRDTGDGFATATADAGSGTNCSSLAQVYVDGVLRSSSSSSSSSC